MTGNTPEDKISKSLDEIELALHLQHTIKKKCKDPCEPVCKSECATKPINKCRRNCCQLLKSRQVQVLRNKADMSKMQKQLEAAFKMEVPKYARRPKPTAGKGPGCGSPPRTILPPLWMYSMATQKPKPTAPPRPIPPRNPNHKKKRYRKNHADEIGTHRYYISS